MFDWVNRITFDESSPLEVQGYENKFGFQRHQPEIMESSHWHGHIEINYLFNCSADYLINGKKISVPEGRMILFWASIPHQMTATEGEGYMVNIYIPLQAFLSWKFPNAFIDHILHGEVLVADSLHPTDQPLTLMWEENLEKKQNPLMLQVIDEIRNRIRRMSLEPFSTFNLSSADRKYEAKSLVSSLPYIHTILRYIADNYDQKITVDDVAKHTGLHPNYAMKIFKQVMKISIKQYINKLRLQHAQALLIDTHNAVLNIALEAGFGSISRFYDVFQREFKMTPLQFRQNAFNSITNSEVK
ncbi:transcriptional regulator MelR [Colwellia psychrerythraea]|uniref:Transcriptional regulator with only HTH domain, AraC family n=1 Tax=Colwellia psychrerythraea TaxID=28229 RepID=A0A099KLV6_COLPS|nr:transcriptional regulator MelR [Colwellia psychrerythraea]KGJ91210.1 transcriptional regulator with only HTH domain, AraC family [Colwellia psychrerythraea]